jgi:hypothetical protein
VGHMTAPEPTYARRCGHVAASELTFQKDRARSQGTRGNARAHLSMEARSEATGHVMPPEPTSVGRCGLKLQLMW